MSEQMTVCSECGASTGWKSGDGVYRCLACIDKKMMKPTDLINPTSTARAREPVQFVQQTWSVTSWGHCWTCGFDGPGVETHVCSIEVEHEFVKTREQ